MGNAEPGEAMGEIEGLLEPGEGVGTAARETKARRQLTDKLRRVLEAGAEHERRVRPGMAGKLGEQVVRVEREPVPATQLEAACGQRARVLVREQVEDKGLEAGATGARRQPARGDADKDDIERVLRP